MPGTPSRFWVAAAATVLTAGAGVAAATSYASDSTPQPSTRAGQTRIVGGILAPEGAYPWMVRTIVNGQGFCGGTLISKDIVLTAQHCTEAARRFDMRIGKNRFPEGQLRSAAKIIEGKGLKRGDWTIVKLDKPITDITPVFLPANGAYDTVPMFRTIGWGMTSENGNMTDTLREVDIPLVENGKYDCDSGQAEICAGDMVKGGKDSCQGDSGGPLVSPVNGTWVQTGVVSWGQGCGRAGDPGHYTKVSAFLNEMRKAITDLGGEQFKTYDAQGPAPQPQPSQPAPQPTQPAPWPTQPAPQPTRPPAPQPTQPAPWPTQPAPKPTQPAPWPTQPAPQPTRPPAPQPTQPAPWPTQPGQPAPQPTRPRPTWPGMPGMPGQP